MRPGQAAPEFEIDSRSSAFESGCFNEAGAGCPGIPAMNLKREDDERASMRPGQAAPEFKSSWPENQPSY